ncbi:MAG: hypothetical protein V1876_02635 [Candidatus Peregrinibacteria bacterium]
MKRLLPMFGLLLLLPSAHASAAGDQYADLPPVSPYVRQVVDRVRQGLDAAGPAATTTDQSILNFWWSAITGMIAATIDTDLRIVEQERDLIVNSPCLRIDSLILEGWMERARLRKLDALRAGNSAEANRLVSIQRYLNDRYKALLLGARDPEFEDLDEGGYFSFDPEPFWCCPASEDNNTAAQCRSVSGDAVKECTRTFGTLFKRHFSCENAGCTPVGGGLSAEDEKAPCPFDTDYLPPTTAGYGCDLSVLNRYTGTAPDGIRKEIEGLQAIVEERDRFIAGMETAKDTIEKLEERLGGGAVDLTNFGAGASTRRTHQKISGCIAEDEELPDGVSFWESRGPFSHMKQEIVLMPRLAQLWHGWGGQRLAPEYMRVARYLPAGSVEQQLMQVWEKNVGYLALLSARNNASQYMKQVSLRQADSESTQIAKSIDAPKRILQSLAPLRTEVRNFALSVQSSNSGIRKFVRDFAGFLRASCVFRPCGEQLDRVLKIVLKDECFPYANGAKLEEDVAEPCQGAAGL